MMIESGTQGLLLRMATTRVHLTMTYLVNVLYWFKYNH